MSLRQTVLSGVKWTTIGTTGRAFFQLLQISILARFLSKEDFGLVAMALLVVQFSNIFVDMGFTSSILHRQNSTRNEYSSIYWLNILISLFLFGLLILLTPSIVKFYNEPELGFLIPILGTNLLFLSVGQQHKTIMQKQFQFKAISLIELFSFFIGLIFAIFLAVYDFGLYSLVYSTLFASFISNSLFLTYNLRLNPLYFHFNLKETKPYLKIGGFTLGSTLLDFLSRETDVLIIGKMLGAENLGIYSLAKQIVLKIYSIINPVLLNVLSPLLSSIQNEKERLKKSFLKIINNLAYFNFPIYSIIIFNSKEILIILYGTEYSDYYSILSFLAFSYCLSALSNPVGSLQIATGRTDIGFKWTILRFIVTPIIVFVGALISIQAVAAFYAMISLILIIPLWFIQLKPLADINLREYALQFYKPLLFFFSVILFVFLCNETFSITDFFVLKAVLKAVLIFTAFLLYVYIVDKNKFREAYSLFLIAVKRN